MQAEVQPFGCALRRLRKAKGLRAVTVAERAGLCSESELCRLERNKVPNAPYHRISSVLQAMEASWQDLERELGQEHRCTEHHEGQFNGSDQGSVSRGSLPVNGSGRDGKGPLIVPQSWASTFVRQMVGMSETHCVLPSRA